jgi:hypothetical protein
LFLSVLIELDITDFHFTDVYTISKCSFAVLHKSLISRPSFHRRIHNFQAQFCCFAEHFGLDFIYMMEISTVAVLNKDSLMLYSQIASFLALSFHVLHRKMFQINILSINVAIYRDIC